MSDNDLVNKLILEITEYVSEYQVE